MGYAKPIAVWTVCVCLLISVFVISHPSRVKAQPGSNLIITEIMFDPKSKEDNWEWVEIYNSGSSTINLAGYVLDDGNTLSHSAANISSGSIIGGRSAVLYNADDVSAADFRAAWGDVDLIAVTGWSRMSLNNSFDDIALWDSYSNYEGDHQTQANAVERVEFFSFISGWPDPPSGGGPSIYLKSLGADNNSGPSWALSTVGGNTPVFTGYQALSLGGNSGLDIGSPGRPPEPEPTETPTETATATQTETAIPTETSTATFEPTATETLVPTATETEIPTETSTPTFEPTATETLVPTATETEIPTETSTATIEPTATETLVPTATETEIPTETSTATIEPTATETLIPTATETEIPVVVEPIATATLVPTQTETAIPTETSIPTAEPTATETLVPTQTETAIPTETSIPTAEPTATETFIPTSTETAVPTETSFPTAEPTATETLIPTQTETATPTETSFPTAEPTASEPIIPVPPATSVPAETLAPTVEATIASTPSPSPTIDPITNGGASIIFLPIAQRDYQTGISDGLPDLVIDSITFIEQELTVTIKNIGPGAVKDTFWIDLFINPTTDPVQPNDTIEWLFQEGYVWGIDEATLPILPGQEIMLRVNGDHYSSFYSNYFGDLQAGDRLVGHIDSAHANTNYGAVFELHEYTNEPYNNISIEVLND